MKRLPWIITTAALCAGTLTADSSPKRAQVRATSGPILQITFTGLVDFLKTEKGYRVILPERLVDKHIAYLQFERDDALTPLEAGEFKCGPTQFKWVSLDADGLTIDPDTAIAAPLFGSEIPPIPWLPHLGSLAGKESSLNPDFNQAKPIARKVAAQIDVTRGTLEVAGEKPFFLWDFKTEDGIQSSSVPSICGVSGTNWSIALKSGTKQISLVSSLTGKPIVTFSNLSDGVARLLVIGNTRPEDIDPCDKKGGAKLDPDFMIHYKILSGSVPKKYFPVKPEGNPQCDPTPRQAEIKKSLRGSDCMGGQWP
jgi:hypothetical protein